MKLYLINGSESDFSEDKDMCVKDSSNAHSAGFVMLATDEGIVRAKMEDLGIEGNLVEVPLDKQGVVLFANGDC